MYWPNCFSFLPPFPVSLCPLSWVRDTVLSAFVMSEKKESWRSFDGLNNISCKLQLAAANNILSESCIYNIWPKSGWTKGTSSTAPASYPFPSLLLLLRQGGFQLKLPRSSLSHQRSLRLREGGIFGQRFQQAFSLESTPLDLPGVSGTRDARGQT